MTYLIAWIIIQIIIGSTIWMIIDIWLGSENRNPNDNGFGAYCVVVITWPLVAFLILALSPFLLLYGTFKVSDSLIRKMRKYG